MTKSDLQEKFFYSFGNLYYRKSGKKAGWEARGRYPQIYTHGKLHYLHRLVYLYHHSLMPEMVDHIDNDPNNNKIENLRPADKAKNAYNSKTPSDNTSGFKGVSWGKRRQKWRAYITHNKQRLELGHFQSKSEAAKTVAEARDRLHGEYAR